MKKRGPLTFEEATLRAKSYRLGDERLRRLLERAVGKSERHFESLLAPWESLQIFFRMIRERAADRYPAPANSILMMIAGVIYFVSSFDAIPDLTPVFGLVDDTGVICGVARANLTAISNFRKWEVRNSP